MCFSRKSKAIELSCLTTIHRLSELFPPVKVAKALPYWWKKVGKLKPEGGLGNSLFSIALQSGTIRNCPAVYELFDRAIALPLWCDYFVQVDSERNICGLTPSRSEGGQQHPIEQYPGMMSSDWVHWKVMSPWLMYTNKPAKFLMLSPFFHIYTHDWQAMPGVVDFHRQHSSHVNMVFRAPKDRASVEYEFHAGDIVAYLIPLFDGEVKVTAKQISESERDALQFEKKIWFRPLRAKNS